MTGMLLSSLLLCSSSSSSPISTALHRLLYFPKWYHANGSVSLFEKASLIEDQGASFAKSFEHGALILVQDLIGLLGRGSE